jgi:hypothetical protein
MDLKHWLSKWFWPKTRHPGRNVVVDKSGLFQDRCLCERDLAGIVSSIPFLHQKHKYVSS